MFSISVIILATSTHPTESAISTRELCKSLELQYRRLDRKQVIYDVEMYFAKGAPCTPLAGPPPNSFLWNCHWKFVHEGAKFRTERLITRARPEDADMLGERLVRTWDGIEGRIVRFIAGEEQPRSASLMATPTEDSRVWDHSMTWLGWWVLETPQAESFVDLLMRENVEGPELMPDGRTRWRGELHPPPSDPHEFILTAERVDGDVQLREVELRYYYDQSRAGDTLKMRSRWVFCPIRREQGEAIAHTAEVFTCIWRRGQPQEDSWGYSRITLQEVSACEITPTTFREPIGQISTVVDHRYRIAYEQDKQYINVNGRILETHEPVHGDGVGHNLEWWVERGKWWPIEDSTQPSPGHAESP